MNRRTASAAAFAVGLALFATGSARGNPMDLAPERLTICSEKSVVLVDGTKVTIPCGTSKNVPNADGKGYTTYNNYFQTDKAAWAKLMSQYAMAIAPNPIHPARTTGYAGFEMSLFGTITSVSKDERWMKDGTEGAVSNGKFPSNNSSVDPVLQVYGVTGRKGLPYGFELAGSAGYMANTEMVILGGGIRWSLVEGLRHLPLPDISVGGYVNTLTGTAKVKITVPSFDVQVSRPFAVANQVQLQPFLGWQMLWILVDSSVLDGTPGVDGLANCNARPASAAERTAGDTGEFHCQRKAAGYTDATAGSPEEATKLDLNNNQVFPNLRYRRQRLLAGLSIRYEVAHLTLYGAFDLTKPEAGAAKDQSTSYCLNGERTACDDHRIDGLSSQWTLGMMTGLSW